MSKRMSDQELWQRFGNVVLTVVWLACIYGLIASIQSTRQFLDAAVKAPGVVVALRAGGSHPTVEYTNTRGERISYPQNGLIFGFRVGDKVTVLYLKESDNPQQTIDRFGAVWTDSIGFAWMVVMFPLIVAGKLIGSKLKNRKASEKWKISD